MARRQRLRLKIFLTTPAACFLDFINRVTQLDTSLLQSSTERSSPRLPTAGEPYTGSVLVSQRRSLSFFKVDSSAAPPVLIIAYRWVLPETNHFQVMKAEREAKHAALHSTPGSGEKISGAAAFRAFFGEAGRHRRLRQAGF